MSSNLVSIGNVVWTRVQPAWMCWPLKFGFLRVLNTTFQNVFLSLITGFSISEFFKKSTTILDFFRSIQTVDGGGVSGLR